MIGGAYTYETWPHVGYKDHLVPISPQGPDFILLTHYTWGFINVPSILPTNPWGNLCMHAVYDITWYGMVKYVYMEI